MKTQTRTTARTIVVALRALTVATVVLGIAYPLVITGIGQFLLPAQANGSIITNAAGQAVGSALLGQSFTDAAGNPLPKYFQPRPSAAADGYNGGVSSASNYGPENTTFIAAIAKRKAEIAQFNGVSEAEVPADAVTASASGLDPDISPEYAEIQVDRVARARGISREQVETVLAAHTKAPDAGYLGEARVNVLEVNLALDNLEG